MTEQQAHDVLGAALPRNSSVTLSRSQWSRSTVGGGPVVHRDGDWNVTVTIPQENDVDRVESAFHNDLQIAVQRVLESLDSSNSKPDRLAAPSIFPQEENQRREVS
ncbi:MAG TPA: hypothetical protein VK797_27430 [Tepidisphaeraceae bacterium]|jgi:hypothetical protein|nr:hypothetical protein [Tepidisphaeraceae bacterium]